MQPIEEAIVEINQFKIEKPHNDPEMTKRLNSIQRKMEESANITAVELDDRYDTGETYTHKDFITGETILCPSCGEEMEAENPIKESEIDTYEEVHYIHDECGYEVEIANEEINEEIE